MPTGGRRLTDLLSAPSNSGSMVGDEIKVVYGIEYEGGEGIFLDDTPDVQFDYTFDPTNPWAQRSMYKMCTELTANLRVLEVDCWMIPFREWMLAQGLKFPAERFTDFNAKIAEFVLEYPLAGAQLWLNADGNMRATAFTFKVERRSNAWPYQILEDRQNWLDYVNRLNGEAATAAKNAWPTSQAWVDAEAEHEAVTSAWNVFLLCVLVTIVSGVLYTRDVTVVCFIMVAALGACVYLTFFMFCLFGWHFGPWEVTLFTLFFSYAIVPGFRIGREYISPTGLHVQVGEANSVVYDDDAVAAASLVASPGGAQAGVVALVEPGNNREDNAVANANLDSDSNISEVCPEKCLLSPQTAQEARVQRATVLVSDLTVAIGIKMLAAGFVICFCEFRLFARLGAVAVVLPFITVPFTLLLVPTALLLFGPVREVPDTVLAWRWLTSVVSTLWT